VKHDRHATDDEVAHPRLVERRQHRLDWAHSPVLADDRKVT
jgi:hypothetical protein